MNEREARSSRLDRFQSLIERLGEQRCSEEDLRLLQDHLNAWKRATAMAAGVDELYSEVNEAVDACSGIQDLCAEAPRPFACTDCFGLILEYSRSLEELLWTKRTTLVGRPLAAYVDIDDRMDFCAMLNAPSDDVQRATLRVVDEYRGHFQAEFLMRQSPCGEKLLWTIAPVGE